MLYVYLAKILPTAHLTRFSLCPVLLIVSLAGDSVLEIVKPQLEEIAGGRGHADGRNEDTAAATVGVTVKVFLQIAAKIWQSTSSLGFAEDILYFNQFECVHVRLYVLSLWLSAFVAPLYEQEIS